jgi:hypothetical protein
MNNKINIIVVLFLIYVLIIKYKKNKNKNKNKSCLIEKMTDSNYDNFIDKQFTSKINDPLHNVTCSPDCCPSVYSCDKGCLCINDKIKKTIEDRGSNRDCKYGGYI